ncbi:MAG: pyroglutamyl-peptidase I [Ruminococcaceae bacterium]|nr:pyroglutamyl-peptidase I [Oscillospiraceae bacterium]
MRRLLITGFEPFGGEKINPSWEAVKRLPDMMGEYELTKLCIPVTFEGAAKTVNHFAAAVKPDVILCIGQAGGRSAVTPELVGINLKYGRIPDNAGEQPMDERILVGGADAYFSTVPARQMAEAIAGKGLPAQLSYTAGAYVCNCVFYSLLAHFENTGTKVGFIHVPFLPEQAKNGEPSMQMDEMVKALTVAIETL